MKIKSLAKPYFLIFSFLLSQNHAWTQNLALKKEGIHLFLGMGASDHQYKQLKYISTYRGFHQITNLETPSSLGSKFDFVLSKNLSKHWAISWRNHLVLTKKRMQFDHETKYFKSYTTITSKSRVFHFLLGPEYHFGLAKIPLKTSIAYGYAHTLISRETVSFMDLEGTDGHNSFWGKAMQATFGIEGYFLRKRTSIELFAAKEWYGDKAINSGSIAQADFAGNSTLWGLQVSMKINQNKEKKSGRNNSNQK